MTERGTAADFARWVQPHLAVMTNYAARRVAPQDRDEVVQNALIRAWQDWSGYDASRRTPAAWLLGLVGDRCRRHRAQGSSAALVELVDHVGRSARDPDDDLACAVGGLNRRQRAAVDLHHFVGLDVATVAEVIGCRPGTVPTILHEARLRLRELLGDDVGPTESQLAAAGRRWQAQQPPPPAVPVDRLGERLPRWDGRMKMAVAAAVVIGIGGAVMVAGLARDASTSPDRIPPPRAVHMPTALGRTVSGGDLSSGSPHVRHQKREQVVTTYERLSATGHISGQVHPGDTLVFTAVLESSSMLTLHPCPTYRISFGPQVSTGQLDCEQVPYFASVVRPNGQVSAFRPVLPANTEVGFEMRVRVPNLSGEQRVLWTLDGRRPSPGFHGIVHVAPR